MLVIPMAAPEPYDRAFHSIPAKSSGIDSREAARRTGWQVNAAYDNAVGIEALNHKLGKGSIVPFAIA
jgi:hypothetical protein